MHFCKYTAQLIHLYFALTDTKDKFIVYSEIKGILSIQNDLNKINHLKNIDYLLFDYKPEQNELPGGNSKTFEWKNVLQTNYIPAIEKVIERWS